MHLKAPPDGFNLNWIANRRISAFIPLLVHHQKRSDIALTMSFNVSSFAHRQTSLRINMTYEVLLRLRARLSENRRVAILV